MQIFDAAFTAGAASAANLSDAELEELSRYTGIVGLIAEHIRLTRQTEQRLAN